MLLDKNDFLNVLDTKKKEILNVIEVASLHCYRNILEKVPSWSRKCAQSCKVKQVEELNDFKGEVFSNVMNFEHKLIN